MQRNQHSPEFIEQALSKARMRGTRTLAAVAAELNMSLGTLKGWLKRLGLLGAGLPHAATLPGDVPSQPSAAGAAEQRLANKRVHPVQAAA